MNLAVKNLSFSYDSKKDKESKLYVLNDINCNFEEGKMYALIGKSGSGKSTLLSLLGRLDLVNEGEIIYDEKNINDISRIDYLRNCCTMVYQDARLFLCLQLKKILPFQWNYRVFLKKNVIKEQWNFWKRWDCLLLM